MCVCVFLSLSLHSEGRGERKSQEERRNDVRVVFFMLDIRREKRDLTNVSSYCYSCVLILLLMCPHTATNVSSYCMCPDIRREKLGIASLKDKTGLHLSIEICWYTCIPYTYSIL